jgi:hypothetical protein
MKAEVKVGNKQKKNSKAPVTLFFHFKGIIDLRLSKDFGFTTAHSFFVIIFIFLAFSNRKKVLQLLKNFWYKSRFFTAAVKMRNSSHASFFLSNWQRRIFCF